VGKNDDTLFEKDIIQGFTVTEAILSGFEFDDTANTVTNVELSSGLAVGTSDIVIKLADIKAPIITLVGTNPLTVEWGSVGSDPSATASDNYDGNITANIISNWTSIITNTSAVGDNYTVTYIVSDSSNNQAQITRTIKIVDTVKSILTLNGSSSIKVTYKNVGSDLGATANDNYDGNLTSGIISDWATVINNNTLPGNYTVTYSVTDSSGNISTATRTVEVISITVNAEYKPLANTLDIMLAGATEGYTYQYWILKNVSVDNSTGIMAESQVRRMWMYIKGFSGTTATITVNSDYLVNGKYNIIVRVKEGNTILYNLFGVFSAADVNQLEINSVKVNGVSADRMLTINRADGLVEVQINTNIITGVNYSLYNGDEQLVTGTNGKLSFDPNSLGEGMYILTAKADNGIEAEFDFSVYVFEDYDEANTPVIKGQYTGEVKNTETGETEFTISLQYANKSDITNTEDILVTFYANGRTYYSDPVTSFSLDGYTLTSKFTVTLGAYGIYQTECRVSRVGISGYDDRQIVYFKTYNRMSKIEQMSDKETAGIGQSITIMPKAGYYITGATGALEVAYYREDAAGWILIKDYADAATASLVWTPSKAGTYNIQMRLKEAGGGSYDCAHTVAYTITDAAALTGNLTAKAYEIDESEYNGELIIGKPYQIKASYDGNEKVLFQFTLYNETLGTVYLSSFGLSDTFTFIPYKNDKFIVTVRVIKAENFGFMDKTDTVVFEKNDSDLFLT